MDKNVAVEKQVEKSGECDRLILEVREFLLEEESKLCEEMNALRKSREKFVSEKALDLLKENCENYSELGERLRQLRKKFDDSGRSCAAGYEWLAKMQALSQEEQGNLKIASRPKEEEKINQSQRKNGSKPCTLISPKGRGYQFPTRAAASRFLGRSPKYISNCTRENMPLKNSRGLIYTLLDGQEK